jgi:hypothetical protein
MSVHSEPMSPRTAATQSRLRGADVPQSVCPYCAIGCGLLVFYSRRTLFGLGALSLGGGLLLPLYLLAVAGRPPLMLGAVRRAGGLLSRFVIIALPRA